MSPAALADTTLLNNSVSLECPFPGLASYDYDRRASFRGRDEEARDLAAMILGRRLTVLTSGSGDGKTSLIHAGVAPLLLEDGIEIAIAEPGGRAPLAEIGKFCLDRLLLNRGRSYYLMRRLIRALGADKNLQNARDYCLGLRKDQRQQLLAGRGAARPVNLLEGGALVTWLRDPKISDNYLAQATAAIASEKQSWPGTQAPLAEIQEFFKNIAGLKSVNLRGNPKQVRELLIDSIKNAVERRQRHDEDFELVLVLDQFEEIFTQFRDVPTQGADRQGRWQQRAEVITFVVEMLKKHHPVRIVLSLRKEHYADLQSAFGDPEMLAASTYHLAPLTTKQALECLTQPHAWPGSPPTTTQAQAVVEALRVEQHFVHPTLLSVVGEWLWLHPDRDKLSQEELSSAIPGAIDEFVRRAFEGPKQSGKPWTMLEQHEALDILDQLIIRDGSFARRSSVAETTILDSPLRRRPLRKEILEALEKSRLVRRETRLGEWYIEIVHERLIEAINGLAQRLRMAQQNIADLPLLLDELRYEAREPVTVSRPLPRRLLPALFANVDRVELPPVLAARVLGRLLLDPRLLDYVRIPDDAPPEAAPGRPMAEPKAGLRNILRKLAQEAEREESAREGDPDRRIAEGDFASPSEADAVRDHPEMIEDTRMLHLILASALVHRDVRVNDRIRDCAHLLRQQAHL